MDGPSGLTHLGKKPKVREDCVLETQPFLVYRDPYSSGGAWS